MCIDPFDLFFENMFENSDDFDFTPSSSSKLASLFGESGISDDPTSANSSLVYTAPKQPKIAKESKDTNVNESVKSKVQSSVVTAKAVTLWKLDDGNYKSLGKYGIAIIGATDLNLFEIISYKEKNNVILRRKLNSSCNFYKQNDCFSSFYDNDNQNWLVKFQSIDDQDAFCKEIQNLGANVVDNKVSSNPTQDNNSVQKENVTKPDILPREGIPPKPGILPRSTLALENDVDEANSDSSGSVKRANILSRMAKMGQSILPKDILKTASTDDISDSEIDDAKSDPRTPPRKFKRAVPLEKHIPRDEKLSYHVQQNSLENQIVPSQGTAVNYPQQNTLNQFPPTMISPVFTQPIPYEGFYQYVVSQNTELKMSVAQISAKLDSVLNVGGKSDITTHDGNLKSRIKALELRSENLLTELERYEKKYGDLQKKYKELEDKHAANENNVTVIDNLNRQVMILQEDLNAAQEKITNYKKLEVDLEKYRNDIAEYEKVIDTQKLKLKDLETFYEKNKDNANFQGTIDTLNDSVANLKQKLKDYEEHFLKIDEEKQKRVERNEKAVAMFSEKIKDSMNNMYQSIQEGFEEGRPYSLPQIKSQVAQNLKSTTFALIKEFKDIYENENMPTQ
ncbi:hypothetical protein NQ315_005319 [Exocentrus adspersus]|uniref:Uncharacterized protein n=1 Tax=Exocentrus adspersus TaxID=1586481 RepID=A0AAV8W2X5_9CUCU|nr:hypothetical protein NQ315_005319 [Exocentrus adspersus]